MNEPQKKHSVLFLPDQVETAVEHGSNLMEAAIAAGVHINASCGGMGTCGTCKVKITEGEIESNRGTRVSADEFASGIRQSCQCRVTADVTVEIPPGSRLETAILGSGESLPREQRGLLPRGWTFDPPVHKIFCVLSPPTTSDNSSDLTRLLREVKNQLGMDKLEIEFNVITGLARILRQANWQVTATVLREDELDKIIKLEPGDRRATNFGLVFDIGTTGVRGQLLDLNRGKVIANSLAYNAQISYGADVITRMMQCQKPEGLSRLQKALVGTLNEMIGQLLQKSGVNIENVNHLLVAANTVMVHLLLGIDPLHLRISPYVPTVSLPPPVRACDLGIETGKHVHLCVIPSVASYVGGDIVSGIMGSGVYQREEITLYIDIGTNGEIVVGNRDWMVTAAASAGPTFEGGGIKHGMLATSGAIEDFSLSKDCKPTISTIGNVKPLGICGSGIINAVAAMLKAGVLGPNGKFNHDLSTTRVRQGEDGYEYVLAYAEESDNGKDITLSEIDVDNMMRAKAAIFAACQTLIRSVGSACDQLDRVIIAGSFGHHLDIENAITIGLLPDMPIEKFIFIGNGSLLGARLASFSRGLEQSTRIIAAMMTNLELSERSDYMDNYMAAMFLPHTNHTELFPSVKIGATQCL